MTQRDAYAFHSSTTTKSHSECNPFIYLPSRCFYASFNAASLPSLPAPRAQRRLKLLLIWYFKHSSLAYNIFSLTNQHFKYCSDSSSTRLNHLSLAARLRRCHAPPASSSNIAWVVSRYPYEPRAPLKVYSAFAPSSQRSTVLLGQCVCV